MKPRDTTTQVEAVSGLQFLPLADVGMVKQTGDLAPSASSRGGCGSGVAATGCQKAGRDVTQ